MWSMSPHMVQCGDYVLYMMRILQQLPDRNFMHSKRRFLGLPNEDFGNRNSKFMLPKPAVGN